MVVSGTVVIDDVEIGLTDDDVHDLNELSSITTLTLSGEEIIVRPDYEVEQEPRFGEGDRVCHVSDRASQGTVVGLTDDPRYPFDVTWDDEETLGGAYGADELVNADEDAS